MRTGMLSRVVTLVKLVAFSAAAFSTSAAPFVPVALSGQPAPGASGAGFLYFFPPAINNNGVITFFGASDELSSPNANFTEGIWTGTPGNLNLLALSGQPAPGANGPFQDVRTPRSSDTGLIAFDGQVDQPIDGYRGIWAGTPGGVQVVAYPGVPAPGTNGVFGESGFPRINPSGQLLVHSSYTEAGQSYEAIWTGSPSNLQLVARHGQPAPSISGATFGPFYDVPEETSGTFGPVVISSNGEVSFAAGLSVGGVPSGSALYTGRPGALRLVARNGDPAPGAGPGASFTSLGLLGEFTAAGEHLLFEASGQDAGGSYIRGLWDSTPAGIQSVVLQGAPAPGTGGTFNFLSGDIDVTESGQVAFKAQLLGPGLSGESIWTGKPGDLRLVIRDGQTAPGSDDGLLIDLTGIGLTMNSAGQLAFESILRDAGGAFIGTALYAAGPEGDPTLVVRSGELFEVAPGDLRTVARISFSGYQHPTLNDSGQLVFGLIFSDETSGVFLTTVPEPGVLPVLGACFSLLALRARRR